MVGIFDECGEGGGGRDVMAEVIFIGPTISPHVGALIKIRP